MDPLSVLRDFTIRGELEKIVRVKDEFQFGREIQFPCSVETSYRSKQGNLYTLETLVHAFQNAHLKFTEYLQNGLSLGIPTVTYIDRKPLIDYLSGKLSSTDSIVVPHPQQQQQRIEIPDLSSGHDYGHDEPVFAELCCENDSVGIVGVDDAREVDVMGMIRSIERPVKDREALLECRNRDFYSVLVGAIKREEERQKAESQQRKDGLVAKSRLMSTDERAIGYGDELGYDTPRTKMLLTGGKIAEGVPIILVPSAFNTLITIYNVKDFLEDGVFISTDVKGKQMAGPKPECVTVQKKFSTDRNRVVMAYEVRDKPSALKSEDWDRVVAVFVLGKEWQFKDWPFKDHVEIFNKIIGFHMCFEDDSLESLKKVKQWNVNIISISKNKRHQDRAAALKVWDKLEEFLCSRSRS